MKTRTFRLNKLVRDNIVQLHLDMGGEVKYKTLAGKKLTKALLTKITEEANELKTSDLSAGELVDIKEIIEQIAENLRITDKKLTKAQAKKRAKNGGFAKGHFIDTVTLPANNKWAKYYAADPKHFPEIES